MFIPILPSINLNINFALATIPNIQLSIFAILSIPLFYRKHFLSLSLLAISTIIVILSQNILFTILFLELFWIFLYLVDNPKDLNKFSLWWGLSSSILLLYYAIHSQYLLLLFILLRLRLFGINIFVPHKKNSDLLLSIASFSFFIKMPFNFNPTFIFLILVLGLFVSYLLFPKLRLYDISKLILLLLILNSKQSFNINIVVIFLLSATLIELTKQRWQTLQIFVPLIIFKLIYKLNFSSSLDRIIIVSFFFIIYYLAKRKNSLIHIKIPTITLRDRFKTYKIRFDFIPILLSAILLYFNSSINALFMSFTLITLSFLETEKKLSLRLSVYLSIFFLGFDLAYYYIHTQLLGFTILFFYFILKYRLKEENKLIFSLSLLLLIYFLATTDLRSLFSLFILLSFVISIKEKDLFLLLPILGNLLLSIYKLASPQDNLKIPLFYLIATILAVYTVISFLNIYKKLNLNLIQILNTSITSFILPSFSIFNFIFIPFFISGLSLSVGPLATVLRFYTAQNSFLILLLFSISYPLLMRQAVFIFKTLLSSSLGKKILLWEFALSILILYYAKFFIYTIDYS